MYERLRLIVKETTILAKEREKQIKQNSLCYPSYILIEDPERCDVRTNLLGLHLSSTWCIRCIYPTPNKPILIRCTCGGVECGY